MIICSSGSVSFIPTTQRVEKSRKEEHYLLWAVIGSVAITCVTILLALLALFYIRKSIVKRRRTFTYQSGSVSIHISLKLDSTFDVLVFFYYYYYYLICGYFKFSIVSLIKFLYLITLQTLLKNTYTQKGRRDHPAV